MSYRIEASEPLDAATRRIAGEQSDKALSELRGDGEPVARQVHQLRKRCKKIRGLARLVRPGLDEYGDINRAFRDTARLVSSHRDARVMADLVSEMATAEDNALERKAPLVRVFTQQCELAEQLAPSSLTEARRRMAAAAAAIERLPLNDITAADVAAGVEKTLGRAHDALDKVAADGTSTAFHEWRKRCKYHWYHLRLLDGLLPEELAERKDRFDRLGKLVGDAHDRSVLLDRIERLPAYLREAASTRIFVVLALRQRRMLRRRALETADGVFDRPPGEIADALRRHWQVIGFPEHAPGSEPKALARRLSVA